MEAGTARMSSQPKSIARASALSVVRSRFTRNPTLIQLGEQGRGSCFTHTACGSALAETSVAPSPRSELLEADNFQGICFVGGLSSYQPGLSIQERCVHAAPNSSTRASAGRRPQDQILRVM